METVAKALVGLSPCEPVSDNVFKQGTIKLNWFNAELFVSLTLPPPAKVRVPT